MQQYVNEDEVAQLTGLAVQTLRNWRHQRRGFPYIKLGRRVLYPSRDIEKFLEERIIRPEVKE